MAINIQKGVITIENTTLMELPIGTTLYDYTGKRKKQWDLVAKCKETDTITLLSAEGLTYGAFSKGKYVEGSISRYTEDGTTDYISSGSLPYVAGIITTLQEAWNTELSPIMRHNAKNMEVEIDYGNPTNYIHSTKLRAPTINEPYMSRFNDDWSEYIKIKYAQYQGYLMDIIKGDMEEAHEIALSSIEQQESYRPPYYYLGTRYDKTMLETLERCSGENILGEYPTWLINTDMTNRTNTNLTSTHLYAAKSQPILEKARAEHPEIRGVISLSGQTKVYHVRFTKSSYSLFIPST